MSSEWAIKTDTLEDALRFCKIGSYAGFFWCFQIVLGAILVVFMRPELITDSEFGEYGAIAFFGEKLFVFMLAWIFSLRIYSGKGYISAILLLVFYIGYRIFLFIAEPTFSLGLIMTGFIIYAMYAGILGTQAVRRFSMNKDQDPSAFG